MNPIIITGATMAGIGGVCGVALALASRFLAVKEDPRVEAVTEALPGANCGGCGYAGCADYAKAIVMENTSVDLCAPGGAEVIDNICRIMGKESPEGATRKVAIVLCGGDRDKSRQRFSYNGVADCVAAHAVDGGDKACRHGCLGYGSCARVCPVDAIEIRNGLAYVHPEICIGCGACVKACPRHIITMAPVDRNIHVLCSSKDKGPIVKKVCEVGCIGCRMCAKLCENDEITMDGFLAVIDYDKTLENDKVVEKCPTNCITRRYLEPQAKQENQIA